MGKFPFLGIYPSDTFYTFMKLIMYKSINFSITCSGRNLKTIFFIGDQSYSEFTQAIMLIRKNSPNYTESEIYPFPVPHLFT